MSAASELPSWITTTRSQRLVRIVIYAQPGSKISGVVGEFNGALKVKISSRAIDGAANESLREWLVQKIGVKIRDVSLIQGQTSRRKVFEIAGLTANEISDKLHV